MNKYQEALDKLIYCANQTSCGYCKFGCACVGPDKIALPLQELVNQQSILEEYNVTPEILREVLLTGQMFRNQPTLDDCIKEWEKRGFEVVLQEKGYVINGFLAGVKEKYISIRLKGKQYVWLSDETFLSHEEVHLLSKTIKAWENNNETK